MKVGDKFKVSFARFSDTFMGEVIEIDNRPENSDRQFKIRQTMRRKEEHGYPYSLPDGVIEVEENWFDTELTGRKITML